MHIAFGDVEYAMRSTHSEIPECAGKILFPKNRTLLCERDSLECVCQRADVRDTRVALNHRFLDYRVTRGKAEKDFVETRGG